MTPSEDRILSRVPLPLPLDRRQFFGRAGTLAAAFGLPTALASVASAVRPRPLGFTAVPRSVGDELVLPKGYVAQVIFPWGTPVDGSKAAFDPGASGAAQRGQAGMNHDGQHFFPIDANWSEAESRLVGRSDHGYLAMNHEFTDEGKLHRDGTQNWAKPGGAEKVRKSKAAHGVSVLEIRRGDGGFEILGGRRITALDPVEIRGPARGHALLRTPGEASTAAEKAGTGTTGTMANCASGKTPWGTYLTCEEYSQDYFARTPGSSGKLEDRMVRYSIGAGGSAIEGARSFYGWEVHDPRFDADRREYRNACHRYGWIVEIDPRDPSRKPVKRTALGRFSHENAAVVLAPDGRVVVYMADDSRFEYVYKFVSKRKFVPGDEENNWKILDEGELFVARFDADETGEWIALDRERKELRAEFGDQAEVLVFARRAADLVAATSCDRPEWITCDQVPGTRKLRHAYVSMTNNVSRGVPDLEGPNAVCPRVENVYGQIVRWSEADGDAAAGKFTWETFVTCGYRMHPVAAQRGDIRDAKGTKDQDYGSPDALWLDPRGILWVATDVSNSVQDDADYRTFGNNALYAVDKDTGETRRFMVGPKGCEITGIEMTPDYKTLFINIQHPGKGADPFTDPERPLEHGAWPNGRKDGRTRSATVIITHSGGAPIGSD